MRGTILNFDAQTSTGLISGEDGQRYDFSGTDVAERFERVRDGVTVDFQTSDSRATSIYPVITQSSGQIGNKNKIVAGLLAIFLGGLGIHKFYLGYSKAGVIMLLCSILGFILLAIPTLIIYVISLVEGIIYLTKTDSEFYETYEVGKKSWF
ncbi:TM2 domain-containing protein [Celeribacter ethanolicus]|uniref:TM2 domain-containing protein n=1 Tax=Celeribacter ethanolicus TaxID=1758178 RepID=A0A291G8Q4_9RHOB|nr:TM2 domain-containing protein [Celeribacter ethanolicus]ATG46396.1 TM2 domain-containing protein [Celeribacter ethanolicus]TNE65259.1 MAG: TM2 domain-containing protein [Paracoccaceae bacterium]